MKKQKKQQIDLLKTMKNRENLTNAPKDPKKKKGTNPFVVLFVIAILLTGVYTYLIALPKEDINTDVGLNDIQARYAS
jgi:hypothetical protein